MIQEMIGDNCQGPDFKIKVSTTCSEYTKQTLSYTQLICIVNSKPLSVYNTFASNIIPVQS